MGTFDLIMKRRSIRKFKSDEIPKDIIEKILCAGINAPSAKNRQPWKFIVVTGNHKDSMLKAMGNGIEKENNGSGLLPNYKKFLPGAEYTMRIMAQAPVTIFIFNTEESYLLENADIENKFFNIANIQSIGAAIENMILAAAELNIGSLWINDIYFAYRELCEWFNEDYQLIAAVSFGYPDETPDRRPRKKAESVIEWR